MQHFKEEEDYLFGSVALEMKMYTFSLTGSKGQNNLVEFAVLIIVLFVQRQYCGGTIVSLNSSQNHYPASLSKSKVLGAKGPRTLDKIENIQGPLMCVLFNDFMCFLRP